MRTFIIFSTDVNVQVNPSNAPLVAFFLIGFVFIQWGLIDDGPPDISEYIPHVVILIGILIVTRRRFGGTLIHLVTCIMAYIIRMLNLNLEIEYEYEYKNNYEVSAPQSQVAEMNLTLQKLFKLK